MIRITPATVYSLWTLQQKVNTGSWRSVVSYKTETPGLQKASLNLSTVTKPCLSKNTLVHTKLCRFFGCKILLSACNRQLLPRRDFTRYKRCITLWSFWGWAVSVERKWPQRLTHPFCNITLEKRVPGTIMWYHNQNNNSRVRDH